MAVMTVRRRPTTQRALTWTGENANEVADFLRDDLLGFHDTPDGLMVMIRTKEHRSTPFEAPPGSVLMEGRVHGEHWAVDSQVFTETYRLPIIARVRAWLGRKARD